MTNKTLSQELCSIANIKKGLATKFSCKINKECKDCIQWQENNNGCIGCDNSFYNSELVFPDLENNNDNFVRLLEIKYKDEVGQEHYAVDYLQNHIDLNTKALIIHQIIELYKPDDISMFDLSYYDRQILYRIKQSLQSENWSY